MIEFIPGLELSKQNYDLIIFAGAPGSGKSTIGTLLQRQIGSPLIDFGWLREFHLDPEWKNESQEEQEMAFENLVFILRNYAAHGYGNVIVNDLDADKVTRLVELFKDNRLAVITLVVSDEEELKERIAARKNGFTNVDKALFLNRQAIESPSLPNETRVDTAHRSVQETVENILDVLK